MLWIILAILIAAVIIILALIWWVLAPLNLFFTFVKEGQAKIIVKGDQFEKALIQWEGYTLDREWNVIKGREPWHPFGGLRFYGVWPFLDVYTYQFQWTGVTEEGKVQPHPKEWLDYILLKDDVYWCKIERAEDKDLLPLDVELLLTARVVNPYKALFNVQNWLETLINRLKPMTRDYIAENRYETLTDQKEEMGNTIYKRAEKLRTEFEKRYGIKVVNIGIKDIEPPEEYREQTLKKYTAERERERVVIEADAEKRRISATYGILKDFGDLGKLIRSLEAMEKSKIPIQTMFHLVPGLEQTFRGVFKKEPEAATREEVDELKRIIKQLVPKSKRRGRPKKKGS